MSSSPLQNYLRTYRKRLTLSQEEVAFLLGFRGQGKGAKVCRDERFSRTPSLETALAYAAIYQKPVRELFAGLYEQIEQDVAERARILNFRKGQNSDQRTTQKRQALADLAAQRDGQSPDQEPA